MNCKTGVIAQGRQQVRYSNKYIYDCTDLGKDVEFDCIGS